MLCSKVVLYCRFKPIHFCSNHMISAAVLQRIPQCRKLLLIKHLLHDNEKHVSLLFYQRVRYRNIHVSNLPFSPHICKKKLICKKIISSFRNDTAGSACGINGFWDMSSCDYADDDEKYFTDAGYQTQDNSDVALQGMTGACVLYKRYKYQTIHVPELC